MSTVGIAYPPFINDEEMKKRNGDRNWTAMKNEANIFHHKINGQYAQGFADLSPICH